MKTFDLMFFTCIRSKWILHLCDFISHGTVLFYCSCNGIELFATLYSIWSAPTFDCQSFPKWVCLRMAIFLSCQYNTI